LISDGLEIIHDSRAQVKMSPLAGYSTDAEITNTTTGDSSFSKAIYANGSSYGFAINITDTWLDMKVNQGINKIHYKFIGTPDLDEGDVYFNVEYSQATNPDLREVFKTPEECATPSPTPKP
jgi:hypothetical protein